MSQKYDVVVIGAGHAGCEAALASARLGLETIMFTVSVDSIALMPCNPNIGGSSKGHLVREMDALGGEMGKNIDRTFIQSKMLNVSKGPAVHSLRAQADKAEYSRSMRRGAGAYRSPDHQAGRGDGYPWRRTGESPACRSILGSRVSTAGRWCSVPAPICRPGASMGMYQHLYRPQRAAGGQPSDGLPEKSGH